MHFMAPVNLGNGKSNVVKSTPGVLFYSQDNSNTNSPVYASNKLETTYFKMAPRTVNGNSLMQESPQVKRFLKPSNGSVNVNNASLNIANMPNSEGPKYSVDSDANGICKLTSNTFSSENVTNSICESVRTNSSTVTSQTFGLVSNSVKPLSRVHSINHDEESLNDLPPIHGSDSHGVYLKDTIDAEYKECLSMHEDAISRLNSLQTMLKCLTNKCTQIIGKQALTHSKHLSASLSPHDNSSIRSILQTCARELDSDETDSSSDEEAPPSADSSENSNTTTQSFSGLTAEESWLCCRAVYHAQWQWLLFEIQHAEFALHNIRTLALETQSKIKQFRQTTDIAPVGGEQCARTVPFKRKSCRQKVYRLDGNSSAVVDLLSAGANGSCVKDGSIRCNCRMPDTGSCVLCLGRIHRTQPLRPWSRLNPVQMNPVERALPLDSTVHYKLSSPADIPPSLVMELRLRHNLPPVAKHWSTPYSISIPLPQLSPTRSPSRPSETLNLSTSSSSSSSSNISMSKSVTDANQKSDIKKRRQRSHYSQNDDFYVLSTKRSKLSDGAASRDGSCGSTSGAAIDSRRTSQDYFSETCPSPGLPMSSRLTRVPCVDVELPGWRLVPTGNQTSNHSQSNSQSCSYPTNHIQTVKVHVSETNAISADKSSISLPTSLSYQSFVTDNSFAKCANLRLRILSEHSNKEDITDEVYEARHSIEEENERLRVLGVDPNSSNSPSLAAIPSLRSTGRRSQSDMQLSYQPSSHPGYPPRHFPLTARDLSIMEEEEEKEILNNFPSDDIAVSSCEMTTPNVEEHNQDG